MTEQEIEEFFNQINGKLLKPNVDKYANAIRVTGNFDRTKHLIELENLCCGKKFFCSIHIVVL